MLKIKKTYTDIYGTLHQIYWDDSFVGTMNLPNDKTQNMELKTDKKIPHGTLLEIQENLYGKYKRDIVVDNYGEESRYPMQTIQIDPFSTHNVTIIKMGKKQSLNKAKERAQMLANTCGLYIKLLDHNGELVDKIIPRKNPFTGKSLNSHVR